MYLLLIVDVNKEINLSKIVSSKQYNLLSTSHRLISR